MDAVTVAVLRKDAQGRRVRHGVPEVQRLLRKFVEDGIASLESELAKAGSDVVSRLGGGDIANLTGGYHRVIDCPEVGEILGKGVAKGDIVGGIADNDHVGSELEDLCDIVVRIRGQWRRIAATWRNKAGRHTVPGGSTADGDVNSVGELAEALVIAGRYSNPRAVECGGAFAGGGGGADDAQDLGG